MRLPSLFLSVYLLTYPGLFSAEILTESELHDKMIAESVKGEWYPLSNKVLPYAGFKYKHGLIYRANLDEVPFTGWYSQFDTNKQVRLLTSFMAGKLQGLFIEWDKNGSIRKKGEYFDGEKDGTHVELNEKGKKISERNYLIGKLHGESNFWYNNGSKKLASTFEHGLIMEAKGWLYNGKPCPYTKVKNGKGVIFNFGDGFVEQLLQSSKLIKESAVESNKTGTFDFGELKINF